MSDKDNVQALDSEALADVLQEHADALINGDDKSTQLLEQHPAAARLLGDLFRLAARIYRTLVTVEPSDEFVSDLKAKLAEVQTNQAESALRWHERRKRFAGVSKVLGITVSVLAIIALLARLIGSIVMVIVFIIGIGRRRRSAAAA